MEHYYSICQVAKLLNLTPQTLRFYEKEGLIHPKKAKNGYRQYSMENIREIQDIIYYRNVDMSLEEIRTIFYHTDLSAWEKILNEKIKEEQEKIMRHRSYLNRLELFSRSIAQSAPIDTPVIRKMPLSYILYQSKWPLPLDKLDSYSNENTYSAWTYEVFENAPDKNGQLTEPDWIIRVVEEDTLENISFDQTLPPPVLELSECVNLLLPSPIRSARGLNLAALLKWCKKKKIQLDSTIYTRYLFNSTEEGHCLYYMELFCPIIQTADSTSRIR